MNDSELENLLRSVPSQERPPEFWENLPTRIRAKIHRRTNPASEPRREVVFVWQKLAWGFSAVVIAVLIVLSFHSKRNDERANGILQNPKLAREVLEMFPNQVQAIVQDENGLSLSLADKPDVPTSTPLWIKCCDGKHCRSFVTFSGQFVQIGGQQVEVLADARGGVLLVGERFLWASDRSSTDPSLHIQVGTLNETL